MAMIQDAAEPLSALDCTVRVETVGRLLDELVIETLVVALKVVVVCVLLHGLAKVALAQRDDLCQTLWPSLRGDGADDP